MKKIKRILEALLISKLQENKVLVLLGARRVGKTILIKQIISKIEENYLLLNGEDEETHTLLKSRTVRNYKRLLGKTKLLIIDEAQAIPDIGIKLKLMIDEIDGLKIIVTGSSVFDLENKIGEPLVGRKKTFYLFPLAQMEFNLEENFVETKSKLEERLIFGSYPELEHISSWQDKITYLKEQVSSYLLKDILAFEGIKKRDKLISLLRILAFRVGSEISVEGIGNELQIGKNTVDKYLDLLSKVFIIYKLSGFSRNLDNEITKKKKWYFYDNGIRNAIINNFNNLELRNDKAALWENYVASERIKFQKYNFLHTQNYFWRTHTQQEIDWVEETNTKIAAYEFKWNPNRKIKIPALWKKNYPKTGFENIHPDNYLDFIS